MPVIEAGHFCMKKDGRDANDSAGANLLSSEVGTRRSGPPRLVNTRFKDSLEKKN